MYLDLSLPVMNGEVFSFPVTGRRPADQRDVTIAYGNETYG
jgi:hypothetical protein